MKDALTRAIGLGAGVKRHETIVEYAAQVHAIESADESAAHWRIGGHWRSGLRAKRRMGSAGQRHHTAFRLRRAFPGSTDGGAGHTAQGSATCLGIALAKRIVWAESFGLVDLQARRVP